MARTDKPPPAAAAPPAGGSRPPRRAASLGVAAGRVAKPPAGLPLLTTLTPASPSAAASPTLSPHNRGGLGTAAAGAGTPRVKGQGVVAEPSSLPGTKAVTHTSNKALSSRFRGVCWNKKNRRWQAAINASGKYLYLGSFVSEDEAAKAFDRAAIKIRGRRGRLNFPNEPYTDAEGNLLQDIELPEGTVTAAMRAAGGGGGGAGGSGRAAAANGAGAAPRSSGSGRPRKRPAPAPVAAAAAPAGATPFAAAAGAAPAPAGAYGGLPPQHGGALTRRRSAGPAAGQQQQFMHYQQQQQQQAQQQPTRLNPLLFGRSAAAAPAAAQAPPRPQAPPPPSGITRRATADLNAMLNTFGMALPGAAAAQGPPAPAPATTAAAAAAALAAAAATAPALMLGPGGGPRAVSTAELEAMLPPGSRVDAFVPGPEWGAEEVVAAVYAEAGQPAGSAARRAVVWTGTELQAVGARHANQSAARRRAEEHMCGLAAGQAAAAAAQAAQAAGGAGGGGRAGGGTLPMAGRITRSLSGSLTRGLLSLTGGSFLGLGSMAPPAAAAPPPAAAAAAPPPPPQQQQQQGPPLPVARAGSGRLLARRGSGLNAAAVNASAGPNFSFGGGAGGLGGGSFANLLAGMPSRALLPGASMALQGAGGGVGFGGGGGGGPPAAAGAGIGGLGAMSLGDMLRLTQQQQQQGQQQQR
jgi:hypothetical protein